MLTLRPFQHPQRVYCAGPLFNEAERRTMCEIAESLAKEGFEPFVPHADGLEFTPVMNYLVERGVARDRAGQIVHQAVFALDVYQVIEGCGSLVCNLNGRVPDEGAVAEATMAWMLGKPIVAFKDDVRSAVAARDNPLIAGQFGFRTVGRIDRVAEALAARIAELQCDGEASVPCPAHLVGCLKAGEQMWKALREMGEDRPSGPVAFLIWELFEHSTIIPPQIPNPKSQIPSPP